jgi:hypothetical protein
MHSELPEAPVLPTTRPALPDKRLRVEARLQAIEAQLATLHEVLTDVQILQQRLLNEVSALQQQQGTQTQSVDQLAREVRRGRWFRRIWVTVRLLFWLTILGALAYFFLDWATIRQWFV